VARFDASGEWAADGAKTAAAWLAWRCRIPQQSARRMVRLGRACRDQLPVAGAAWRAGDVDAAHVALLAAARTERTAEVLARHEQMLVGQASTLRFSHFQRALAYWSQLADPDGADDDAERLHEDRRFDISTTFQGAVVGDLLLDPVSGAIVTGELRRLDQELFDADWAEAKARLGRDPAVTELRRSPKQRRADALVEMATRSATPNNKGRRPAPLFSVLVGYETFAGRICQLANGTVVAPGALVAHLGEVDIERVVFDGPSRVIDLGERRRLFTGGTRRAVQVRDQECFDRTCDEPAEHAQIDHIIPWATGGPTTQANGRVACGFHNRQRHARRGTQDDEPP
jgi:hypothetical protein